MPHACVSCRNALRCWAWKWATFMRTSRALIGCGDPGKLVITWIHVACLGLPSASRSSVLPIYCMAVGSLWACVQSSNSQPLTSLCRYLWTIHRTSEWAVCMRMPLACMATTRHGAPGCTLSVASAKSNHILCLYSQKLGSDKDRSAHRACSNSLKPISVALQAP